MIAEQPTSTCTLPNNQPLVPPIIFQVYKDSTQIIEELHINTVGMYEAIPYLVQNRVLQNVGSKKPENQVT